MGKRTTLTPKQRKAIAMWCENPDLTKVELAEQLDMTRTALYKWFKNPLFTQAIEDTLKDMFKDSTKIAVDTIVNLARDGDYKAAAYILDSNGYKPSDKVELGIPRGINITIGE